MTWFGLRSAIGWPFLTIMVNNFNTLFVIDCVESVISVGIST